MKQDNFRGTRLSIFLGVFIVLLLILVNLNLLPNRVGRDLWAILLMLLLAAFLFWESWLAYQSNRRAYQAFYNRFPELNESVATVMANADYVSPKLGVLIYQNHLLGYKKGSFDFVDIAKLTTVTYDVTYSRRRGPKATLLCIAESTDDSVMIQEKLASATIEVVFRGKAAKPLLDELYTYLYHQNPNIVFN